MTRLLCMRLGTGQPGATLVTCILRDGSPCTQADMWSRLSDVYRDKVTQLHGALADPQDREEAIGILQGLIEKYPCVRPERVASRSNSWARLQTWSHFLPAGRLRRRSLIGVR